jgi:hypothetical protein
MRRIKRRTELLIGVGIVAAGALLAFVVPAIIAVGPSRGIGFAAMVIGVLVVIGVLLPPRKVQGTKLWQNDRYPGSSDDAVFPWPRRDGR